MSKMMRKPLKCLIVFSFLIILETLCSEVCNETSKSACNCKLLLDQKRHNLPSLFADCTARGISEVPSLLKSKVNHLDLSFNNIAVLDPNIQNLSSVELYVLELEYNQITRIDEEFFFTAINLEVLDLSHNSIESLDSQTFQHSVKLQKLDLSFNMIKHLPQEIFKPLENLNYLDLSYNLLGGFLESTSLVSNLNPQITELKLNGMNITAFPNDFFHSFEQLQYLSLADNYLLLVPVLPQSLQYLDLSGNKLAYIAAHYLNYPSLKVLRLNRMESLWNIHNYAFYNLPALEKLEITDCPNLNQINELAFDALPEDSRLFPDFISLARNRLNTLNDTYAFIFKNMKGADLTENPWHCDCDILWLQHYRHILYRHNNVRCETPKQMKGKPITNLSSTDLPECFPHVYGKKSHRILIVMLLVTIVMLFGVIFVLIRYPFSWLAANRAVGPNSPYSPPSTPVSVSNNPFTIQ
ncbi:unnamed protein product [Acanthoscelides obtectus]|uniref:LRRCT domain-containing protein n=1 Tax=Acanthoscelides obtectus TaxID=200917 RepID=A0A9P0NXM8_ACAOB|nr:unnamed protein product [Acanthoscelides obtectus]CAK1640712.1 Leucine-rich repeat neuronal protein 1 [Acanthoscelides obtectus]